MAHEIEKNYAFFASNTPAWHELGTVLKDAPDIDSAWKHAYPHNMLEVKAYAGASDEQGNMQYEAVPDRKFIFRDDGKYIGDVGSDYTLVQPYEMFNSYRPLLESGLVELEAGGSLQEGRKMWALAKVKNTEADILPGDSVKAYILLSGGFDGRSKHCGHQTNVRVVCANTLAMAIGRDGRNAEFQTKHTKHIHARIDSYLNTVQSIIEQSRKDTEAFRALARSSATQSKLETYIKTVLLTPEQIAEPEKVSTRTDNLVRHVIDLLDTQKGLELVPAARGTMWQGYNAISEYVTHEQGRNEDNRLNNQWFGIGAELNQKALSIALDMV